jgi:hypothetical protein
MAVQRPAPGVIPPLRKRVPELARTVVSGPVLAGGLVHSASGCCTATASGSVRIAGTADRFRTEWKPSATSGSVTVASLTADGRSVARISSSMDGKSYQNEIVKP